MYDEEISYYITKKLNDTEIFSKGFQTLNSAWDFWDNEIEILKKDEELTFLEIYPGGYAKVKTKLIGK